MTETPFLILITYLGFATIIFFVGLMMGIRRISGAPFMCIFSGILIFGMLAITDDISGEGLTGNQTQSVNAVINDNMNTQTGTSIVLLRSGSNIFVGQEVVNFDSVLYGKEINYSQFRLSKNGAPSGFMYAGVWNTISTPTATNYKFLISQMDVSGLSTSEFDISFLRNDTKTYVLDVNEAVGIFYNGGSAGNEVEIIVDTANPFDGSNSQRTSYISSWSDFVHDIRGKISFVTHEANEKDEPYDFNQWDTYVYLTFMSVFYIITGVIFQMRDWGK